MVGPQPKLYRDAVARQFGPEARVDGSLGTPRAPGVVSIHIGDRLVGSGPTFERALEAAQRKATSWVEIVA